MTAFELSEKKVRFIDIYNKYFNLEPDCNGKIILTQDELSNLVDKLREGWRIIDEYLKEKG